MKEFLAQVKSKVELADADEEAIAHNLDRLFDLRKYPFTALEIASSVDEEQVADIFVRINSKGVPLNQADFILTLLSVFWEDGRRDLETFCHAARTKATIGGKGSPFHHLIAPDPDQLLRVSIAFGFGRGRLKSVYQILRGKDAETGEFTSDTRLMAQVLPFEIAARELRSHRRLCGKPLAQMAGSPSGMPSLPSLPITKAGSPGVMQQLTPP